MFAVEPDKEHGYAHYVRHREVDPEEDDEGLGSNDAKVFNTVLRDALRCECYLGSVQCTHPITIVAKERTMRGTNTPLTGSLTSRSDCEGNTVVCLRVERAVLLRVLTDRLGEKEGDVEDEEGAYEEEENEF